MLTAAGKGPVFVLAGVSDNTMIGKQSHPKSQFIVIGQHRPAFAGRHALDRMKGQDRHVGMGARAACVFVTVDAIR